MISEFLSVSLRAPALPSSLPWCFGEEVRTAWSFAKEGSGKQKLTAETLKKNCFTKERKNQRSWEKNEATVSIITITRFG